ncbi:MAG: 2-phosphosulfolactate phosphatase [Candidatus Methanomethylicia archaeon]|nr:2-phosphosulfolactate phosphatase [Candidatus Methanomethylicia archaeon]
MVKVDIVLGDESIGKFIVNNYAIAIIDVLRASSTITTALANGALKIYVFREIKDAVNYSKIISNCILAGERGGLKIEGFQLGNSPLEFSKDVVYGKNIIFTSSNCARVVESAKNAKHMLLACFLNLSSTAQYLKYLSSNFGLNIVLVCAGRYGYPSSEDIFCAELLKDIITGVLDRPSLNNFSDFLKCTSAGRNLINLGFISDVEYCGLVDIFNIVPVWDSEGFVKLDSNFIRP